MKKKKENEEKERKRTKMKKTNAKYPKDLSLFCLHTHNPRRFPRFVVVVVTLLVGIVDDVHDFSECAFFHENQQPILGGPFFQGKVTISIRSCAVTQLCRRGHMADRANLLSAVARRTSATSDSCSFLMHLLTWCLVVSGHLSTISALC